MTLIKFLESTDVNDRHYARGDTREMDEADALKLIAAKTAKEVKEKTAKPESGADSSTLVITDLDGEELAVTAVVKDAVVNTKNSASATVGTPAAPANADGKGMVVNSVTSPAAVPLIPVDKPGAAAQRATQHGAGYTEKTKGSRR